MTAVLKLGGSLVTEKAAEEVVDHASLERAAAAIAGAPEDVVVVHGGGSFGHPAAEAHGVSPTSGTSDASAVRGIHAAMKRLNDHVLGALAAAGVRAVPVHPLSMAVREADGSVAVAARPVAALLGAGFVPVLHGDVVATAGDGATVASGDELAVAVGRAVGADRIGLCTGVPGVLDDAGEVVPVVESFAAVEAHLEAGDGTDVTGGMAGKVRALLSVGIPGTIFGLDDLEAFLAGGSPGTRVGQPASSAK